MKEAKNIAVVGATGLVGKTFLKLLESDHFLDSDIHLLASKKSEGKEVTFRNSNHIVGCLDNFDLFFGQVSDDFRINISFKAF